MRLRPVGRKEDRVALIESVNSNSSESLVIGCVTENMPKFLAQSLRLLQSVRWFGGRIADARFVICSVETIDPEWLATFERYHAEVHLVSRFSTKHPQSNKLRFLELDLTRDYDHVVLLDCDTIVVQDPSKYFLADRFQAKIADTNTVPSAALQKLFDAFDLTPPKEEFHCTVTGESTIPYFNAGVLLFTRQNIRELLPVWLDINRQLLDRLELLGEHANYCEQATLSLALGATGTLFGPLGNEMNFPTHFSKRFESLEGTDPLIIHYHSEADQSGYIKNSGYPLVDTRIRAFNTRLREEWHGSFDNPLF